MNALVAWIQTLAVSVAGVACLLLPVAARAESGSVPPLPVQWQERVSARLDESLVRLEQYEEAVSEVPAAAVGDAQSSARAFPVPQAAAGRREAWVSSVLGILRAHGLPEELVAVVAVESGFRPSALSPKGARGLWQLMPETARRYGLAVGREADERLDPLKSTHAAARYFNDLYAQFADWPLALAAYNAGEQRVERALSRMGARDFWTLARHAALPKETRAYVPAVLSRAGSTLDREIRNSTEARNIVFAISSPAVN
jgi:soluble lytic murein transglycosylase-like protein